MTATCCQFSLAFWWPCHYHVFVFRCRFSGKIASNFHAFSRKVLFWKIADHLHRNHEFSPSSKASIKMKHMFWLDFVSIKDATQQPWRFCWGVFSPFDWIISLHLGASKRWKQPPLITYSYYFAISSKIFHIRIRKITIHYPHDLLTGWTSTVTVTPTLFKHYWKPMVPAFAVGKSMARPKRPEKSRGRTTSPNDSVWKTQRNHLNKTT